MKRLAFALLFAASALRTFADTEVVDGVEWTYYIFNSEASVSYVSEGTSGAISIPSTLGGCPVTGIEEGAFWGCSNLTSVAIANSVKSIGYAAFRFCSGLTSITIPDSVTDIGELAFGGCGGLESIVVAASNTVFDSRNNCNAIIETKSGRLVAGCKNTVIPDTVKTIGTWAFNRCYGLTSITIPSGVTNIERYAFSGCSGLTSVAIPVGVTSIDGSVFAGCSALSSFSVASDNPSFQTNNGCLLSKDGKVLVRGVNGDITIPSGVTSIGMQAFSQCSGLTSISIPNSVTNIGNSAFVECSGLTSVSIPDSIKTIGYAAFYGCSGLTSIMIPNSVKTIGDQAFCYCSRLTSITIPDSVTSIGDDAFYGCSGLTSITVPYVFSAVASDWWNLPEECDIIPGNRMPLTLVTDGALPVARTGFWYSHPLEVAGGLHPYSFEIQDDDGTLSWLRAYGLLTGHPDTSDVGMHSFMLYVTDAEGTMVSNRFTIVVESNASPVIEAWTPNTARFRMDPGSSTNFSVTAYDSDGDNLSFHWEVEQTTEYGWARSDDIYGPESFSFNSADSRNGRYRITVTIEDGGHSTERSWIVCVATNRPLAILTDEYLPQARTGHFRQEIVIIGGEEPYTMTISDRDDNLDWLETDSIDWDECGYDHPILQGYPDDEDIGPHSFKLLVTDAQGTVVEKSFTVVVESNACPVIVSWIPESPYFRTGPGSVRDFTIFATDSDGDDLSYVWSVVYLITESNAYWFGSVQGSKTFPFNPANYYGLGRYRISVTVSDGSRSEQFEWVVTVDEGRTIYSAEPVPYGWLDEYYSDLRTSDDYEECASSIASNGMNQVWQCYVAGLDPTNAVSRLVATIDMVDGSPVVSWTPDLNEGGTKHERVYTVEGKTNLTDTAWGPTNEATRFFRVKVQMPE